MPTTLELGGGPNSCHHPNLDAVYGDDGWRADARERLKAVPTASLDLIHSQDFFEHLTFHDGWKLLDECYRVLMPGGQLLFLIPDIGQAVLNNPQFNEGMSNVLYGTRRDTWDTHRAWYTPETALDLFSRYDWSVMINRVTPHGDSQPKFTVEATK